MIDTENDKKSTESKGDIQKYNCQLCKQQTQATKQLKLHHCPRILMISLKRVTNRLSRNDSAVHVSPKLDMSPFVWNATDKPINYQVFAVVEHVGHRSMQSGHYVDYCLVGEV